MVRIDDLLAAGRTASFEFFPPKTDDGEARLRTTLRELEPLEPSFVSVTYGAGGSTRARTHQLVVDVLQQTSMPPMAHLTAYGHDRAELASILARYRDAGVENILALRGDPPRDGDAGPGELRHAVELVELAHEVGEGRFAVGVAAHPEVHPDASDRDTDLDHLAAKLRVADFAITQFFFRAHDYLRLVDDLAARGADAPVVPGVMPITDLAQITRFAELSGAAVPAEVTGSFDGVSDADQVVALGVELATQLCAELLDAGAPGLHFYTLNRSTATRRIHAALGLGPRVVSPGQVA